MSHIRPWIAHRLDQDSDTLYLDRDELRRPVCLKHVTSSQLKDELPQVQPPGSIWVRQKQVSGSLVRMQPSREQHILAFPFPLQVVLDVLSLPRGRVSVPASPSHEFPLAHDTSTLLSRSPLSYKVCMIASPHPLDTSLFSKLGLSFWLDESLG